MIKTVCAAISHDRDPKDCPFGKAAYYSIEIAVVCLKILATMEVKMEVNIERSSS